MYCAKCGSQNPDGARACEHCGQPIVVATAPVVQAIPNYLVQAILVTLFCCLPFGIPAIVFAAQVNSKVGVGDYAGAMDSAKKARTWCWAAFWCGLVFALLWGGLQFLAIFASIASERH